MLLLFLRPLLKLLLPNLLLPIPLLLTLTLLLLSLLLPLLPIKFQPYLLSDCSQALLAQFGRQRHQLVDPGLGVSHGDQPSSPGPRGIRLLLALIVIPSLLRIRMEVPNPRRRARGTRRSPALRREGSQQVQDIDAGGLPRLDMITSN